MKTEIEYMIEELTVTHSGKLLGQLNEFGKDSWALMAVIGRKGFFARKVEEKARTEIKYMIEELTVTHSGKLATQLSKLGKDGWALMTFIGVDGVFAREIEK